MKQRNTQTIGEALRDFLEENKALQGKLLEKRIEQAWSETLGPMIIPYTQNIYVRNGVLYVSLSSAVLRSELTLCRERLIRTLNERAGGAVIRDIIIR
jgi:predicted nucleic acid-binding Zn ribbon protein